MQIEKCPLCDSKIEETHTDERRFYNYSCIVCGYVRITAEFTDFVLESLKDKRYLISGLCRERYENHLPPVEILTKNINSLLSNTPSTTSQKINKFLSFIEKKSDFFGESVSFSWDTDYSLCYAQNRKEFIALVKHLIEKKLLTGLYDTKGATLEITMNGLDFIEQSKKSLKTGNQAFVAMWFKDELVEPYEKGIKKALVECGFQPIRIDLIQHNDKIDDRIISEIKRSALLIADFTGQRGGVYFEAGFGMGLKIPVIWTCREDELKAVHFDTRQYNYVVWNSPDELYEKLLLRIKSSIL